MIQYTLKMDLELHKKIKLVAMMKNKRMSDIIISAIKKEIEKVENENNELFNMIIKND